MVRKSSEVRNNLITVKIGGHEFPIALRSGRKIYRVCPVCGAILETSKGWYKHIMTFHPTFFETVNALRIKELGEVVKGVVVTGKPCIDRLIALMPDNVKYIEYVAYDPDKNEYVPVYKIERDKFIEFLKNFTCKELGIKYVRMSNGARVGNRSVDWYFRFGDKDHRVRFVTNTIIRDGIINKLVGQGKQDKDKLNNKTPPPPPWPPWRNNTTQ